MTIDELKNSNLKDKRVKKLKKGIIKLIKDATIDDLVEMMEFAKMKTTLEKKDD